MYIGLYLLSHKTAKWKFSSASLNLKWNCPHCMGLYVFNDKTCFPCKFLPYAYIRHLFSARLFRFFLPQITHFFCRFIALFRTRRNVFFCVFRCLFLLIFIHLAKWANRNFLELFWQSGWHAYLLPKRVPMDINIDQLLKFPVFSLDATLARNN